MTKPAYLKSYGYNNIAVISMIFPSFEAGMKFLAENTDLDWQVKESTEDGHRIGYTEGTNWENEDALGDFYNKIYTSWYFGCGGPGPIVLLEVSEYGEALAAFDLD